MMGKFINISLKQNSVNLLILLLLLVPKKSPAQNNNLRFNRIPDEHGLSQRTVNCALQDSKGFMWFGTQDGLNRYDGYNFKVFKHKPDDPRSLSENWIWTIYEDSSGRLWVGTFGGGACRFDAETETFVTFRQSPGKANSLSHDTVWSFYENPLGTLWIGANDGLNKLDLKTGVFSFYKPSHGASNAFQIAAGQPGILWILTMDGLLEFNISTERFVHYGIKAKNTGGPVKIMRNMVRGRSGLLWFGTRETGLYGFDTLTKKVVHATHNPDVPASGLAGNYISAVYEDSSGIVWAGTRNHGLTLLRYNSTQLQLVQHLNHDPLNPTSLSHDYVFSIYESRTGEVWVGTRDGLNRFDRHNQKFSLYHASPNDSNSLSHKNVLPIVSSRKKEGILWIGTYDGLNRLDQKTGSIKRYKSDPQNPAGSLFSSYILSLCEDRAGDLWIGTRGGLTKMHLDSDGIETFTHFRTNPADEKSLSSDIIHCIYEDTAGVLWFGTGGGGLCRLNNNETTFTRYQHEPDRKESLNDTYVYTILEDRLGRFWVGTAAGGLNLFDRENGVFRHFKNNPSNSLSLSNDRVLCLTKTHSGDIWIGTAAGLNKLTPPINAGMDYSFIQYHEIDGLPNEVIYGILEDDSGNLWVSTNRGIAKVTPVEDGLKVRTYISADGLQSDEFNHNSFHKSSDGMMYFGGVNGLNAFNPDSVKDNPYAPPILITDFKILNETVPINRTAGIVLSYHDYMFSFEFAALNYTLPEKNQYAYMMEGFDEDWIYCGARRFATYTNLDPGEYRFRVKGSNNDGVWNEEGTSVAMEITPPPWKSWWAYGLYGLFILGSIVGFIRYKIHSHEKGLEAKEDIERAKAEERERVRKNSSADFHDEAGHMISKITLFLELAKRKAVADTGLVEYLTKIEENTQALSSGMRDFIWGLDPEKDTLYDTLMRLKDFGNNLFQYSEIRFQASGINSLFKQINLPMHHRRSIIFIFKEVMNNCLKYSMADFASLKVEIDAKELRITFEDDGIGFVNEKEYEGYGLKNMAARAEKIAAKLEINSVLGKGTCIGIKKEIIHLQE